MTTFESQHSDMVHDVQMDYYGKRIATCSSDHLIKIFTVSSTGDNTSLVAELKGHDGPVWQVAWAHPKFGSLLCSCSYDRKVIVWKEVDNSWSKFYEYTQHKASVNAVAWAPPEFGLTLACASSDGNISIISFKGANTQSPTAQPEDIKQTIMRPAHQIGVTSVSWAPSSVTSGGKDLRRLVTGGCDKHIRIWRYDQNSAEVEEEDDLQDHAGWVRDVSWSPNVGAPHQTIASCSQNGEVFIWRSMEGSKWKLQRVSTGHQDVVWRVSWSITGNILAVTSGANRVTLYKESMEQEGEWNSVSVVDDSGNLSTYQQTSVDEDL